MLYDKKEAAIVLGHCCNNLDLLRNNHYSLNLSDFNDVFHKIIFGVLQNLSLEKDINEANGILVDNYLSKFPTQYELFRRYSGYEYIDKAKELSKSTSFEYSYKMLRKFSLLRRFESVGMDISEIYDYKSLDVAKVEEQLRKLEKSSTSSIKNYFKLKLIEIEEEFSTNNDSYKIEINTELDELLNRCVTKKNWGLPFRSNLFNTVFKGMRGSKLMCRSSSSGGGKSRQSLSDLVNISVNEYYDRFTNKWIVNNNPREGLFISTELTKDEIQLCLLSTIAAVEEEKISDGLCNEIEWQRVLKAKSILEDSKIYCEFNSNFSINDLENIIERSIIRNNVKFVFFDYIQVTSNLAKELNNLFGYTLREDQMLNQITTALKNICNKYDIFILTSTQLNRSYKTDSYIDATHLRGGMATADKCDYVVITLKATSADKEKLRPIVAPTFTDYPTHAHHIIKNRGGKWTSIVLWVNMNLDTMSVKDCFATTQDFELIPELTPTIIKQVVDKYD